MGHGHGVGVTVFAASRQSTHTLSLSLALPRCGACSRGTTEWTQANTFSAMKTLRLLVKLLYTHSQSTHSHSHTKHTLAPPDIT